MGIPPDQVDYQKDDWQPSLPHKDRFTNSELPLAPGSQADATETSEELTEEERAAFVGLEWRTARLDGDYLVLSLDFSRPLKQGVEASVYLFGYRADRPFAEMPKLHARFGEFAHVVYDQDQALAEAPVEVTRQSQQIALRVPLALLGDPQRVLVSARTYLGEVPLDWVSWRVLELHRQGARSAQSDGPRRPAPAMGKGDAIRISVGSH